MPRYFALAASLIFLVCASLAHACDCAPPPEPQVALKQATAVFTGKVTSIARGDSHWRSITFEVENAWKGVEGKSVHVVTALSGEACGFHFEEDKTYLVYAHLVGGDGFDAKSLVTNICTRTTLVGDETKAEIEALGPATMREP